jgi:hypothetical protein
MSSTFRPLSEIAVSDVFLCSHLDQQYREELEHLFFFNPRQDRIRDQIEMAIKDYGCPQITANSDGTLQMAIDGIEAAQNLFIMEGAGRAKLHGGVLYVREANCLKIVFIAFKPVFTHSWRDSATLLVIAVGAMRRIAGQIAGITDVRWSYLAGRRARTLSTTAIDHD